VTFGGFDALDRKLAELRDEGARLEIKLGAVPCAWDCETCGESGTARPWRRQGETWADAAARFTSDTRGRCVAGCAFTARPTGDQHAVR
jgi:hypothetical protein